MKHLLICILSTIFVALPGKSQIVINEVLSSNQQGIFDENNEYSDWVELHNTSNTPVDISGYYLSDDKANRAKWQITNYTMPSKSFLVVLASGKDRQLSPPFTWKTLIDHGATWKYKVPTTDLGTTWHNLSYDDATWLEGPSGFGYGDGDDATTFSTCVSVFVRKKFDITNPSAVKKMFLQMHFDDGFVAYINGVEVARSNIGTVGTPVAYNATATEHEANFANSILHPESFEIANASAYLVQGTNVITIQCHNNMATSTDLSLVPILTIGSDFTGEANSVSTYFTIPTNYYHTNFKLDQAGETIYLSSPSATHIDSLKTPGLEADISYGCQPDAVKTYFYFIKSSPGYTNNQQIGSTSPLRSDTVIFSVPGGYYQGGTSVQLSSPVTTDKIYYTIDGSYPTDQSTLYSATIPVNKDMVIKARTYRQNTFPGNVTACTYIVTRNHKFHITSLTTNPANLWDYNTGIYVKGPNAQPNNPYKGANFWQDWEKSAHFEVYDTNKKNVVNQGVGIKIYGAWSRAKDLKSMSIFARKEYGKGTIEYKFFEDKSFDKFEGLVLRNSGNDFTYTMFRDGLITGLARKMNLDRQGFKPSAHYLNGEYWGILNIREKINEHMLASNHKFDTEDLSILSNNGEIVMGTNDDYKSLISFVSNSDLQTDANFQQALKRIDVDNYIQYQMMQIYADNTDWPGNNIKYWRTSAAESQWRWILFDTDFGFGLYSNTNYTNNTLEFATDATKTAWPNPAWSTLLFRRLLTSTQFRNNFITQYCDHLNSTLLPTNVNAQIDSMKTLYEGEIQYHIARWGGSYANWTTNVNVMKTFASYRPTHAWNHLQTKFGLGSKTNITAMVNDVAQGQIKLNSILLDQKQFNGYYFQNIPITLKALPKPGYKFTGWQGSVISTSPSITYNMAAAGAFTANFVLADKSDVSVVINEINYKSATTFDTGDWIELYNKGAATVDLSGWEITDLGKEAGYIFPAGTILYPGDYLVVCEKIKKFRNYRPITRNSRGSFAFGLSSSGDKIRLYNTLGEVIDAVDFYALSPWPIVSNETGATLELKNPTADNTKGNNWVLNNTLGTPGKENLGYLATNIDDDGKTTINFALSCFSNPFVDFTTVEIIIPDTNHYTIDVLDMNGKLITRLINEELTPNTYRKDWNGVDSNNKPVSSGVYFIKCTSAEHTKTIKVIKL